MLLKFDTQVDLSTGGDADEHPLLCANCGEGYGLHHYEVQTFSRREDAEKGLHVTVNIKGDEVQVNDRLYDNPSSRRGGIVIKFWCELCGVDSILHIAQHKGAELVGIRPLNTDSRQP